MILLNDLRDYLTELMGTAPVGKDALANGLQVPGRREIRRVGFGVSASLEFFKLAHKAGGRRHHRPSRYRSSIRSAF